MEKESMWVDFIKSEIQQVRRNGESVRTEFKRLFDLSAESNAENRKMQYLPKKMIPPVGLAI